MGFLPPPAPVMGGPWKAQLCATPPFLPAYWRASVVPEAGPGSHSSLQWEGAETQDNMAWPLEQTSSGGTQGRRQLQRTATLSGTDHAIGAQLGGPCPPPAQMCFHQTEETHLLVFSNKPILHISLHLFGKAHFPLNWAKEGAVSTGPLWRLRNTL